MSGGYKVDLKIKIPKPDPFKLAGFRDAAEIEAEKNPPKPPEVVLLSREELYALQDEAEDGAQSRASAAGHIVATLERSLIREGVASGIIAYHEALRKKAAAR